MSKQGIFWLASYPKSGNTWFRVFLTHILNNNQTLNLNKQSIVGTGSAARFLMDRALGFDSRLLTDEEINRLRPAIYDWHGQQKRVHYFKTHDAYCAPGNATPLIPKSTSLGVIYFIRNPLDVVISFAHHMSCTIEEAIEMMHCPVLALKGSASKPMSQVRQLCSSWSFNVESWTKQKDIRSLIIRYEDMHAAPFATFSKALDFLGMSLNEQTINNALHNSRFENLKKEEQTHGFRESAGPERAFFRKGVVGDWEHTLSKEQVKKIIAHHGDVMRSFAYLDEYNEPIKVKDVRYGIHCS